MLTSLSFDSVTTKNNFIVTVIVMDESVSGTLSPKRMTPSFIFTISQLGTDDAPEQHIKSAYVRDSASSFLFSLMLSFSVNTLRSAEAKTIHLSHVF